MPASTRELFRHGVRWVPVVGVLSLFLVACATATSPEKPVTESNSGSSHSPGIADHGTNALPVTPTLPQLRLGGEHRLGNPQAKIGIVEFSDYQCSYCRVFQQQLFPKLRQEYVDRGVVQFIHKNLPLTRIHPQALPAALAAECAGAQGRFWEMHDGLLAAELSPARYSELARRLRLDAGKFADCLNSPASERAIWRDMVDAQELGISRTPSFLIGRIDGDTLTVVRISQGAPSFEAFAREIEALQHPQTPVIPQTK